MNFLKKIKETYDKKVESFNKTHHKSQYTSENQKQNNKHVSIIESDALGMTIIDDEMAQQTGQEIQSLSPQEWVLILHNGNLKGFSYTRIYFSFLKGIPSYLRYKIWLFFCSENSLKSFKFTFNQDAQELMNRLGLVKEQETNFIKIQKLTVGIYQQLSKMQPLKSQKTQIDKDVHRTYSLKIQYKYTQHLLRRILYALSNSGIQYSQGMNYILLNVIIYCLESIGIKNEELFKAVNVQIERDIFIITREIVIRMDTVFGNNNIIQVIAELEQKIAESVPEVLYLIYKLGMDCFSMFSQHYFSLLSYNDSTPQLNKLMMDLFFVVGQKAIHAILLKMLEVSKDKILSSTSPEQLNQFLKKQLFLEYSKVLSKQQKQARNLSDFGLSFYENRSNNT